MATNDFMKRLKAAMRETTHCPVKEPTAIRTADPNWQPNHASQRIQLIVTGDPARIGVVADAVDQLQLGLLGNKSGRELRITSFLDGCMHNSDWSASPTAAASASRQWHCYESATRFTDALQQSEKEGVNTIVILGSRFDDNLRDTVKAAETLRAQGTRIIALQVGDDPKVAAAYKAIAEDTGGAHLRLTDQSGIQGALPLIMGFLNNKKSLDTVALPAREDLKRLVGALKDLKH